MNNSLDAAIRYTERGYSVIPVPTGSKAPVLEGWQKLRLSAEDLHKHFDGTSQNIGILCGEPSGGLVDVDCDCPEALQAAAVFLPQTRMKHGRKGNPKSHYWYRVVSNLPSKGLRCQDIARHDSKRGTMIVELRANGCQTLVPPSVHPTGEPYTWDGEEPSEIDGLELTKLVLLVAAVSLIVRHYPAQGSRHDCALALAGTLLHHGWQTEQAEKFIRTAAQIAGDDEVDDRVRAVESTYKAFQSGEHTTGLPTLKEFLGDQVVSKLVEWLELRDTKKSVQAADIDQENDEKQTVASQLIEIGREAELFTSERNEAYARFVCGQQRGTHAVRSQEFKAWLTYRYFNATAKSPNTAALEAALNVLGSMAIYDGAKHTLSVRVAEKDGAVWIDIGDDLWRAIQITSTGWKIVTEPPILFRRHAATALQVDPVSGSSVELLRRFLNVQGDDTFKLLVTVIVAAYLPNIVHPVTILHGEKGTAKTTTGRLICRLIDPSRAETRSAPRKPDEWILAADHCYAIMIDNISNLQRWLSDAICRAVTGDADVRRALFTNRDEVLYSFRRIVILTGIEAASQEHDLLDRAVLVALKPILDDARRSETEIVEEFEQARPALLGAIFDIVAGVLRELPNVNPKQSPRLADFYRVGLAVEKVLGWKTGSFHRAYYNNIREQNDEALAASEIGELVRYFMTNREVWKGTSAGLLRELKQDLRPEHCEGLPKSPRALGGELRRISAAFRAVGIVLDFQRSNGYRLVVISNNRFNEVTEDYSGFEDSTDPIDPSDPIDRESGSISGSVDQIAGSQNGISGSVNHCIGSQNGKSGSVDVPNDGSFTFDRDGRDGLLRVNPESNERTDYEATWSGNETN